MKHFIKQLAISAEKFSGVLKMKRHRHRFQLLGLCYHSVVSDGVAHNTRTDIAVSVRNFETQLALIRKNFHPVSLAEIDEACRNGTQLPENAVCVTFDDGYRNNLTLAAPLLKKYEVPAIVFVSTGYIGSNELLWPQEVRERLIDGAQDSVCFPDDEKMTTVTVPKDVRSRELLADDVVRRCKQFSFESRKRYLEQLRNCTTLNIDSPWKRELYEFMNWNEVRKLREFGVTIGAHTVSHPILSRLNPNELVQELWECKDVTENELNTECISIAYPNGKAEDFNANLIEMAQKIGYRFGFTLCEHRNPSPLVPMSIDRRCVTMGISPLEFERLLAR